jgi:acetate kinase
LSPAMNHAILTANGGSSSLKIALFDLAAPMRRLVTGQVERIGSPGATLTFDSLDSGKSLKQPSSSSGHHQAIGELVAVLEQRGYLRCLAAMGHRVVHGGPRFSQPQLIDESLLSELHKLVPLDPDHLPAEIAIIEALQQRFPVVRQVACFDTCFHHNLPVVAQLLPIPRRYLTTGVRRYGFHGLSYEYLTAELARLAGAKEAQGKVIFAHLGSGASLAAVKDGRCLDTTMSYTPTAGLMMGTRSGDLDPGLLLHWLRSENLTADQLDDLVNHRCGLLGVSEISSDMRDLLAREATDERAANAIALFCQTAKKHIGSLTAVLGGLDTLVFSGGIGENAPTIRARICQGLEFLGVRFDDTRNRAAESIISAVGSPVTVRVVQTDEELTIAKQVRRHLQI